MNAAPLVEARGLSKYFPIYGGLFRRIVAELKAVDEVSFVIHRGRTLGLVGESGCGKSTLGRMLLRLQEPTAGDLLFAGKNLTRLDRQQMLAYRQRIQAVFQDPYGSLSPRRTVGQTVREPLDVHHVGTPAERQQRVEELLDVVGLSAQTAHRYPHEFSGGQRQRVGIARALALNPQFLVADEPVSALDVSVQSQVLNLIVHLQRERGIALLFISHDLAVVQHVSDDIGVMYLGRLVEIAPAGQILTAPRHPYTEALLSSVPRISRSPRSRVLLSGEVPSPRNPPPGCAFHARCPRAMAECRSLQPVLKKSGDGGEGSVACHLYR